VLRDRRPAATPVAERTDTELLEARAGDEAAFRELFRRHAPAVYRKARLVLGDASEAEDITQEVFVTAWQRADRIRLVGESALPWLLVTCRNAAIDRLRSADHRRRADAPDLDPASTGEPLEDTVLFRELLARLDAAIAELSDIDRAVYKLCIDEGRSYESAAEALGLSHGTVRNRLSRLRRRLRTELSA
jgi:RNA polymerase sigma factor (sigma-70 family)